MSPPLVTVFGATGLQGSSVINALLQGGGFRIRGVTRNANSDGAKALMAKGVEVVEANLLVKESVEKAMTGSDAVFGVTNFWDPANFNTEALKKLSPEFHKENPKEPEYVQGKNLVEAAKKAGVNFFIWSSLPHATEISKALHEKDPQIKVYSNLKHLDCKADVEKLLAHSGLNYAILHMGWFLENLWRFGSLIKDGKGGYTIWAPGFKSQDAPKTTDADGPEQAFTWVSRDLGPSVLALLKNYKTKGPDIFGKTFHVVSARAPYERLVKALSASIGEQFKFSGEGSSGSAELDEMYEYQARIGMYRNDEVPDPRLVKLGAKFHTIEEFAADPEVKAQLQNVMA